MILRKYRWSRDYESAEEELIRLLDVRKIDAERWDAIEGEEFALHKHSLDKTLWCAEGSLTMMIAGKKFSLQPGDTLDLPANTPHTGLAGMTGCVCYESPKIAENPVIAVD